MDDDSKHYPLVDPGSATRALTAYNPLKSVPVRKAVKGISATILGLSLIAVGLSLLSLIDPLARLFDSARSDIESIDVPAILNPILGFLSQWVDPKGIVNNLLSSGITALVSFIIFRAMGKAPAKA